MRITKRQKQRLLYKGSVEWRENCFDIIKLVAAYMVASVHWTKVGIQINNTELMGIMRKFFLCFPSVTVFFVISGFLAAASRENSCGKKYLLGRLYRIYPELWISVLVNMVAVSWMYWEQIDWTFLEGSFIQALGIAYTPACLRTIPSGSMSGALWTITVQLQFFALIALTYQRLKKMSVKQWGILLIVLLFTNVVAGEIAPGGTAGKILERTVLPYLIWFMFGVVAFIYKETVINLCQKVTPAFLGIFAIYLATGRILTDWGYYADIAITVLVLPITIGLSFSFGKIRIMKDYSFSIFLYHWMVLNIFAYFNLFNRINIILGFLLYLVLVTTVSVGMEFISGKVLNLVNKTFFS